ncbi:hypothetical protein PIB30_099444, partial [Stylosanthes scabra]|nr:hypothetical protein [Stylosanthes scabra]
MTSVGEEKGYQRESKSIRMLVELSANGFKIRCALFGEFVDQINEFLASGYVEQPMLLVQLAKVKIFRGQDGLQNVMFATKLLLNADLAELISRDNYPLVFKDVVGRRVLLKVDGGSANVDKYFGNYRVRCLCDNERLIKLFEDSNEGDGLVTPVESKFVPKFESLDGESVSHVARILKRG